MYHSETPFSFSTFWDSFMLLYVALVHFRCCREFQKVYVYLSFLWMEDIYILSIFFAYYKWGCSENSWGYVQIPLNVHLKEIFASSTWPDIAKLLCEVLVFSTAVPGSFHCFTSLPKVDMCCAFKTCQFDGCEMISYGKCIEFRLAHSRVWVRVSYYFNDHIHNQYDNMGWAPLHLFVGH